MTKKAFNFSSTGRVAIEMFGSTPQQPSHQFMVAIGNRPDTKKTNKDKHSKIRGLHFSKALYGGAYIWRALYIRPVGTLRFKIDWVSSFQTEIKKVRRYRTALALFYLTFEGNFQVEAPKGVYSKVFRGHIIYMEGLLHSQF